MSRARIYFDLQDSENAGSFIRSRPDEVFNCRDEEIAQSTRIKSDPHYLLQRMGPGREKLPINSLKMLMAREGNCSGRGKFSSADCCHVLNRYLPVTKPLAVDKVNSCAYISQFSADGSRFVAGYQDSHIRIYNVDNGWKVQKDIRAKFLRWTITDTSLSPDRRFLVYSSISPVVHIVDVGSATSESVANVTEIHEGLALSSDAEELNDYSFGIFSVKFSTDGREIVAASSDNSIYVYDIEARRLNLKIPAHMSDVNTVCFADESGHIIYSGSDDSLCKVWDRRCFASTGEAAGVLMGHLEGITFIDSRGDGRYFISNGKDQAIKLWDIRKMSSNIKYTPRPRCYQWDYRWMEYPEHAKRLRHPNDLSLATYRGHSVLQTLIRSYFSPEFSTGQKYIYSGSADSSVYIYDLASSAQVARLDYHEAPVRDCNWHPFYPMIVSSSWDGIIAKWEFPDNDERPKRRRRRQPRLL
ncbi:hypothetical protein Leryth_006282 [Lithospermum erythrorhizon]|nr:hypothetical protein Leryth_006282 [Lithospermum erythrorhizon]